MGYCSSLSRCNKAPNRASLAKNREVSQGVREPVGIERLWFAKTGVYAPVLPKHSKSFSLERGLWER